MAGSTEDTRHTWSTLSSLISNSLQQILDYHVHGRVNIDALSSTGMYSCN